MFLIERTKKTVEKHSERYQLRIPYEKIQLSQPKNGTFKNVKVRKGLSA